MAIYRFEAKVISRGGGRSAVAAASYRTGKFANGGKSAVSAAAYRAAAELIDEQTGQRYDYTRKGGVLGAEIMVPEGALPWTQDRQQLWAAVERIEKRRDAQLARDFILTLPHELSAAQRVALVREFVREQFCARGLVADVAWHAPGRGGDDRNYHAHVMVPLRRLEGDQFAAKKDRPSGSEHPAKAWASELERLRIEWANTANRHLEAAGLDIRLDHRSLKEQGIDREPEPKQGPLATAIERGGRESLAGRDRREVLARNAERATLKSELAAVLAAEAELVERETQRMRKGAMKPEPPSEEELRQQHATEAQRLDELRQQEARQAFKQRAEQEAEEAKRRKDELAKEDAQRQQAGEIADARVRYGIALADNYRINDPYGSLAQASMQEYSAFLKGQQELKVEIAKEQDPEKRRLIELRREIEAHDYMAITSERLGGISATLAGREDAPQAKLDRARAEAHAGRAGELREERVGLIAEQARREQEQREADKGRPQQQTKPASHDAEQGRAPAAGQPERGAPGQAQEPAAHPQARAGDERKPDEAQRQQRAPDQSQQSAAGPTQARAGDERKPDETQRSQRAPDPSQQSAAGQTQARASNDKKRDDEDRQQAPGGKEGQVELSDEQRLKLEKSKATREYYAQQEAQKQKDRGDRGGGRSGR